MAGGAVAKLPALAVNMLLLQYYSSTTHTHAAEVDPMYMRVNIEVITIGVNGVS
jgi:hypothetical protein